MMNGKVVQGELFVQKDNVYVLDTDGTRQDIDLQKVSRVVQPGIPSTALDVVGTGLPSSYIKYPDEVVLRGKITQMNSERVMLQTAFAEEPVTCSLAGASLLHFDTNSKTDQTVQNTDMLFHAKGNLRGRALFGENRGISSIQWESLGALKPAQLANNQAVHIRRFLEPTLKAFQHFDTAQFPHALHLQTGETFPCQITDHDGKSISFQSPFISTQHLDSANMKALEFSDRTSVSSIDITQTTNRPRSISFILEEVNGIQNHKIEVFEISKDGKKQAIKGDFRATRLENGTIRLTINAKEPGKAPNQDWMELTTALHEPKINKLDVELERALTVTRFNHDNPPNHILVANTDDIMRGKFLRFNGQMLQFDSKLREFSVPIDRVARVVDVSSDGFRQSSVTQTEVRVTLTDGSMLIFEPLEVKNDRMIGRSSIYGEVSVPVNSIEYLYFGEKAKSFKAAFEKWSVRPAKKPTYSDTP